MLIPTECHWGSIICIQFGENQMIPNQETVRSPSRLNNMAFVLLSIIPIVAGAEDICSREGKFKMKAANVTEAQVGEICPVAAKDTAGTTIDCVFHGHSATYSGFHSATHSTNILPLIPL